MNQPIELLPLEFWEHPDHCGSWRDMELRAIKDYARRCVEKDRANRQIENDASKIKAYQTRIIDWAKARKIIPNATTLAQSIKTYEEVKEKP